MFILNYVSGRLFFPPHAQGFPELNTALFSHPKSVQLQSQEDVAGGTGPATGRVEQGGDVTRECGPAQAFAMLSESSKHAGTREERYFALVTKTCSSIFSQAPAHPKINCWPGYWLLACDYICLMLQSGKQVGCTHRGWFVANAPPTVEFLAKFLGWGKRTNARDKHHSSNKCTH